MKPILQFNETNVANKTPLHACMNVGFLFSNMPQYEHKRDAKQPDMRILEGLRECEARSNPRVSLNEVKRQEKAHAKLAW